MPGSSSLTGTSSWQFMPGWGPLAEHPDAVLLEGPLDKQMLDFSWKLFHIRVTPHEVLLARSRSADIRDRIPLLEIADVELTTSLHVATHTPSRRGSKLAAAANADERNIQSSQRLFQITTRAGGLCNGRVYVLRVASPEQRDRWVECICAAAEAEQERFAAATHNTKLYLWQIKVKAVYDSPWMQCVGALLVLGNFVANVVQFEVLPEQGSPAAHAFKVVEEVFTVLFLLELLVNLFANWFKAFWHDFWNTLDFVVVLVSLAAMFLDELPGVSVLRLIRVFRYSCTS